MFYLNNFCCICISNFKELQVLSTSNIGEITYYNKLITSISEMHYKDMNDKRLICKECCENLDIAYKFRQKCLKSKTVLSDYISQLHSITNISGILNVSLTDIKRNVDKNKISIKTREEDVKRKEDYLNIQYFGKDIKIGNVIIKAEIEDEDTIENVDEIENNELNINNDVFKQIDNLKTECENEDIENREEISYMGDDKIKFELDDEDEPLSTLQSEGDIHLFNSDKQLMNPINDIKETASQEEANGNVSQNKKKLAKKNKPGEVQKRKYIKGGGSKQKICKICNKTYASGSILTTHMRTHTDERPYECCICNKRFRQNIALTTHIRTHTGERPYVCDICGKKFSKDCTLTTHMRTHTGIRPYQCKVCGKSYSSPQNLTSHMLFHTGEKPHDCKVCGHKFRLLCALKEHMRTHSDHRPYQCSICDKTFRTSSVYTTHLRTHSPDKPFQCSVCNLKINSSSTLKVHMRTHTGERPYQCEVCDKKFTKKWTLTCHTRIHTGEKLYECDICYKKFIRSYDKTKHMKQHINEKE